MVDESQTVAADTRNLGLRNVEVDVVGSEAHRGVAVEPAAEVVVVLQLCWRPCNFRKCQRSGVEVVLKLCGAAEIFTPVVALNAHNIVSLSFSLENFRHRVVVVNLLDGSIASDGGRLRDGVALIVVEVHTLAAGRHDDLVVLLCSFDAALFSAPRHYYR